MIYAVVAALAVAGALYYLLAMHGSGNSITGFDNQRVSAALMSQLYSIANNETLANRIGIGTAASGLPLNVNGSALVAGGKPAIIYVGADFCPYCSITRWSLVIALMRFGNFTSLRYMTSSASDIYANTATFTFYNSSYSSALLSFIAVEVMTNDDKPLQTPNGIENATFGKYSLNNTALPADIRGSIPFIDFANKSVQVGALVTPESISGMDWAEIVAAMHNSSSQVAQAIIGSANVFTAYMCASNASLRYSAACNQSYIAKIRLLS
jgi:hypothetical protein